MKKDPVQAYSWYAYQASLGDQNAKKPQERIEESLTASELPACQEATTGLQAKLGELAVRQGLMELQ